MRYCIALDAIEQSDRDNVGGKAYALSGVLREGLTIPSGLAITAAAYDDFARIAGLRERIMIELGRKDFRAMRWEEIWDGALRIRNLFVTTPLPPEMSTALHGELQPFGDGRPVVIRSSAPGEDSAERSFAGLHESFVGIAGIAAIVDHVKLVWASLWSDRALLYRRELGLDPFRSRMAVVIQELVEGEVSGIAFGKHPANPSHRVVEAVSGLNQALVDGSIAPDRWTVDRETDRIIAYEAGDHGRRMIMRPEGPVFEETGVSGGDVPLLTDEAVSVVAAANSRLEALFKSPQDVEWTMTGGRLVILQSRPITTSSSGSDDQRPWFLSLTRSFGNLRTLRRKIEDDLIPLMIAEADDMAAKDLSACDEKALAVEVLRRALRYSAWVDTYWADFIPYAHGVRLFGMIYNDAVRPDDPFEFTALLAENDLESVRRNDLIEDMAEMVRRDPVLRSALRDGLFADETFNGLLETFIGAFGDLACGAEACVSGRQAVAGIVIETAARPRAARAGSSYPLLRERFLSRFDAGRRDFAEEVLELGRSSYSLRDNDNLYLGRIKMQFIRALETFQDRFGSIDRLKGEHPEIARAVTMLPDDHPLRPAITAGALTTDKFVTRARQLTGQPAGPGIARGTARVIINHGDLFTFKAGEILVCDSIDPTMTFVTPLAAAVVERRGGMLIHGAIIAREYGLPCVTGIQDATLFIKTGDTVTVDGYLGIVTIG